MSTKKRKQPVRRDPPTRTPDGARPWDKLKNPDPEMHYVYANPSDDLMGVSYYESLGYTQVIKTEGGVRSVMDTKGDSDGVVTSLHCVLMQIPKALKAELDAPGQAHADELEKRIIKKGGIDGLRGQGGFLQVQNETSKSYYERRGAGAEA